MANGRTRKTEDRLLKAREFTKTLARNEPDIRPAEGYRLLESWRDDKISRSVVNSDNDLHQIPKIQHFSRWFKMDIEIVTQENFREWTRQYFPQTMHNNPFWNTPLSPYNLGGFEKEYLLKCYNEIMDLWFRPLGVSPPIITVSQAVWISILVNTNPELIRRPIDVWLFAEYCSSIHIDKMHDTATPAVTPTSNPVLALDKSVFDYINSTAWGLSSDFIRYSNMVNNGEYKKLANVWDKQQVRLEPSKNLNNMKAWEYQFPMLYGSQIPNMSSLSPHLKVLHFLSSCCLEWLDIIVEKKAVTDEPTLNIIKIKCMTIRAKVTDARESKGIKVIQFVNRDIEEGNDSFQIGMFTPYYRLLVNLAQLLDSKPNETILDTPTLQDFTSVKSYKENQNEKGRDERKPLDDSKPKEYNWINWDDDKEYT